MKLKSTMLFVILFIGLNAMKAQTVYKYAVISWASWNSNKLIVSLNGVELLEEKIDLPKGQNSVFNVNPLLLKVAEYQSNGWEVVSMNSYPVGTSMCHIAYLRKK